MIVGATIVVVCASLIYTDLIAPAIGTLREFKYVPKGSIVYFVTASWWVMVVTFALATMIMSVSTRQSDVTVWTARRSIARAEIVAEQAARANYAAHAVIYRDETKKAAALAILEEVILAAIYDESITPEQADVLRSLLNTEPETPQ